MQGAGHSEQLVYSDLSGQVSMYMPDMRFINDLIADSNLTLHKALREKLTHCILIWILQTVLRTHKSIHTVFVRIVLYQSVVVLGGYIAYYITGGGGGGVTCTYMYYLAN